MNTEVYFVIYDPVEENNIGGYVVSSPHKIIDASTRGFWTGDEDKFPYNADFTPWEEVGDIAFFDKRLAENRVNELAEID